MKEDIGSEKSKMDVREQLGWIEGVAGKIIDQSREKLSAGIAQERKELADMKERLKLKEKYGVKEEEGEEEEEEEEEQCEESHG